MANIQTKSKQNIRIALNRKMDPRKDPKEPNSGMFWGTTSPRLAMVGNGWQSIFDGAAKVVDRASKVFEAP